MNMTDQLAEAFQHDRTSANDRLDTLTVQLSKDGWHYLNSLTESTNRPLANVLERALWIAFHASWKEWK